MSMTQNRRELIRSGLYILIGFLSVITGIFTGPAHPGVTSLILLVCAAGLYFYIVLSVAGRNWMDIRAVFHGIWLGTIGLAALRLTEYQEPWQTETWLLLAAAYGVFQIGAGLGIRLAPGLYERCRRRCGVLRLGRFRFSLREDRLFTICVVTTLIGLACFGINVAIKGFVPCFSSDEYAYQEFYTRFHVFAVAATGVAGLCYYCIRTQKTTIVQKIILLLCIFYLVFLFPVLVVSRGVFLVAALSLTVTVFYLHGRKLWVLALCLIIIMGTYMGTSRLRNYSEGQLDTFTDATDMSILDGKPEIQRKVSKKAQQKDNETDSWVRTEPVFELPPQLTFLYSYLTVSHDNFNEAVKYTEEYTLGIRQLAPFNVLIRSQWLEQRKAEAEYYQVNPYLNTTNLIGDFYYDFRGWGVVVLMFLWAVVFGLIQGYYESGKGPFSLLALGNVMTPVALSFFSTWLSLFNFWMMWGVALLLAVAGCAVMTPKTRKAEK